jgi:hypothetical protein
MTVTTRLVTECRLLGYKDQVRTSQDTYYFAAELSRLMLWKI